MGEFDLILSKLLEQYNVPLYDLSGVSNDEHLFFDSDHLNKKGVQSFFEDYFAGVLLAAQDQ